jgi:hypothetical protein
LSNYSVSVTPFGAASDTKIGLSDPGLSTYSRSCSCFAVGLAEAEGGGSVTITGKDPILSSRHRFGEVMAASQAALGIALAAIWKVQTGAGQDVTTDVA